MKVSNLIVVLALAVLVLIAGYTSYIHMYELAEFFGQEVRTAVTTPLTVDLAMVVVSVRARIAGISKRGRRWCYVVFSACIGASLAANVTSSLLLDAAGHTMAWRIGAAIVSTWPVALLFGLDRVMMNTRIQRAVRNATTPSKSAPAKTAPAKVTPAKKAAPVKKATATATKPPADKPVTAPSAPAALTVVS